MATPTLSDEQILEYEQRIKDEEAEKMPLVCQEENISQLVTEYKDNGPFLKKVKHLSEKYDKIRKCRGDGNCFFRAFGFAWFENSMRDDHAYKKALSTLKSTYDLLVNSGFQTLAFEDFYETTVEQFMMLPKYRHDPDMLLVQFQSNEISNAIVMHLRFIASAYLRLHAPEYEPFLIDEMISIDDFCSMHVEAFGRESDHLQIIALTKALDMPIDVIYLDGGQGDAAVHSFNDDTPKEPLTLIYRPGHYDILYKK